MKAPKLIDRPPVRTQFIVFTLFGDYILPREGKIWAGSLLYLLELLGVSERAARSTLSRMSRKGWLISRRQGRRSQYSLTARGWSLLKQGEQRIFEPPFADWDGLWHIVVYSLPEEKRRLRRSLRHNLTWLGFGSLAPGTWVSPHNRKPEVESICRELEATEYVELFSAMHLGHSSDRELVRRCWDLPGLEKQYRDFIRRYQPELHEWKSGSNGSLPDPVECFVRRFWLTHEFQSFPLKDPNLPIELLPPDFAGIQARELFREYRSLLSERANTFVDDVVYGDGYPPKR